MVRSEVARDAISANCCSDDWKILHKSREESNRCRDIGTDADWATGVENGCGGRMKDEAGNERE